MSLLIHIFYSGKKGAARQFAEEMMKSGNVDKIRAEEGNLRYAYFFPAGDSETVLLIDEWRDQAALDAHHKSETMKIIASLREKYKLKMKVERFISEK